MGRNGLEGLEKSGLLQVVVPELLVRSFNEGSARYNLWEHLVRATEAIQPDLALRWASLLHDIAKPLTFTKNSSGAHFYGHDQAGANLSRTILTRLHYPKTLIDSVERLIPCHHMFQIPFNASDAAVGWNCNICEYNICNF